ncbi:hypothetical protein ALC53_12440 [Atta colombica]|uniref:Uncharacterized protein n=1 Tax=Atta colombica TaxID=520822 RepID=A0A195AYM9_9HYME|nr:hypothetical protein ALC53_12440 [Atta colombica]
MKCNREDALARTPMELIFLFVLHDKDDNAEAPTSKGEIAEKQARSAQQTPQAPTIIVIADPPYLMT